MNCLLILVVLSHSGLVAQGQNGLGRLKNYVLASEQIHTCGAIKPADLQAIHKNGVKTVISLNTESPSKVVLLKKQAEALGMNYVHIPVSWERPTLQSLERFFEAMDQDKDAELLVHCRLNWRASAFVYLYRTLRLKEDKSSALESLHQVWKPERNKTWGQFLQEAERYFQTK